MQLARKLDPRRFGLSTEAEALLRQPGWERVSLADGDAAQASVVGWRKSGPPANLDLFTAPEPPEPISAPPLLALMGDDHAD